MKFGCKNDPLLITEKRPPLIELEPEARAAKNFRITQPLFLIFMDNIDQENAPDISALKKLVSIISQ